MAVNRRDAMILGAAATRGSANVASFYLSHDGANWKRIVSFDVSGYHHNMGNGFISLRPALFASGTGRASFGALRYQAGL